MRKPPAAADSGPACSADHAARPVRADPLPLPLAAPRRAVGTRLRFSPSTPAPGRKTAQYAVGSAVLCLRGGCLLCGGHVRGLRTHRSLGALCLAVGVFVLSLSAKSRFSACFQLAFWILMQNHRMVQKIFCKKPFFCKKILPKSEKMIYSKAIGGTCRRVEETCGKSTG